MKNKRLLLVALVAGSLVLTGCRRGRGTDTTTSGAPTTGQSTTGQPTTGTATTTGSQPTTSLTTSSGTSSGTTTGSKPTTGTSTTTPTPKDWTDSEKKIMQEHLQGEVLPYYYIADYEVIWYENWGCVSIEAPTDETHAFDLIDAYAAVCEEAGYTMYQDSEGFPIAEKELTSGDFLDIYIYAYYLDESYTSIGFTADASIVPAKVELDAWPTDVISSFLSYIGCTGTVPTPVTPDGTKFALDVSGAEDEDPYITAYVLDCDEDVATAYLTTLQEAKYQISVVLGVMAISYYGFGDVYLSLGYEGDDFAVTIFGNEAIEPVASWPTEQILEFTDGVDVPAYTASEYYVSDYSEYGVMYVQSIFPGTYEEHKAETEDAYIVALEGAGYIVDDSQYESYGYAAIDPTGTVMIYFYLENEVFTVDIECEGGSSGELVLVDDISTLVDGDYVVMATSIDGTGEGVTGWNGGSDATVSEDMSDWMVYLVEINDSKVYLYDEYAGQYVYATSGSNAFKYSDTGVAIDVDENGAILVDYGTGAYSYFYRNENNGDPKYRFYKASHATEAAYTPFYLYVIA